MMAIGKGKISKIKGGTKAVVQPLGNKDQATDYLVIPEHLRHEGLLETGTVVVYVYFDDYTGMVLGRMDGVETLDGVLHIDTDVKIHGNVKATEDVTGHGISLKGHVHEAGGTDTSGPK